MTPESAKPARRIIDGQSGRKHLRPVRGRSPGARYRVRHRCEDCARSRRSRFRWTPRGIHLHTTGCACRPSETPTGSSPGSVTADRAGASSRPHPGRRRRVRRRSRLRPVGRSTRTRRRVGVAHQPGRPGPATSRRRGDRPHRSPVAAAGGQPPHPRARRAARVEQRAVPVDRRGLRRRRGRSRAARSSLRRQRRRAHRARCRPGSSARAGHRRSAVPGDGALLRPPRPGRAHDDVQHRGHPGQRRTGRPRPSGGPLAPRQRARADAHRLLRQLPLRGRAPERVAVESAAGLVGARSDPVEPGAVRRRPRAGVGRLRPRSPGDVRAHRRRALRPGARGDDLR